jgi:hypothetical protein
LFFSWGFLLVIVPGLCYNGGAAARRGLVCVSVPGLAFSGLPGALSFVYGIIIAHSHLLVKSFCESFSRFSAIVSRSAFQVAFCPAFGSALLAAQAFRGSIPPEGETGRGFRGG